MREEPPGKVVWFELAKDGAPQPPPAARPSPAAAVRIAPLPAEPVPDAQVAELAADGLIEIRIVGLHIALLRRTSATRCSVSSG
ncbi:MAG: hypothetical protein ACHQNA_10535 [Acidimicrobiales bacterium]